LLAKKLGLCQNMLLNIHILISFPKAMLRKPNPFAWLLGRRRVLEGIHLISLCCFPLKRSSLSFAFESLLPLLRMISFFPAYCVPL